MATPDEYIIERAMPMPPALRWVERQTHLRTTHARMLSGPVQGRLLTMLVRLLGARKVLELGTFSGYSAICLAFGLPDGGHLDTLEINDEMESVIREGFRRSGLEDRITLHIGDCLDTMRTLESGTYDLVYMDANKRDYTLYYPLAKGLLRPGGVLLADNVLWDGKVLENPMPQDRQTVGIAAFNDMVAADEEVESVILPLRDGINIIRKKCQ